MTQTQEHARHVSRGLKIASQRIGACVKNKNLTSAELAEVVIKLLMDELMLLSIEHFPYVVDQDKEPQQ